MKYKSVDLELPPIGEILVTTDGNAIGGIGYFYLSNEKRLYKCMVAFPASTVCTGWTYEETTPKKWAALPKFKSLKKNKPPIGIEVVFCAVGEPGNKMYGVGINIKDSALSITDKTSVLESWIELEVFDEDK